MNWFEELESGRRAYFQHDLQGAETHFQKASVSGAAEPLYWLGKTQFQREKLNLACDNLGRSLQKRPHAEALLLWVQCALPLARYKELWKHFAQARNLKVLNYKHWDSLGEILEAYEVWALLGRLGLSLLSLPNKQAQGYYYLGLSCHRLLRADLALSCFLAGLQLRPEHHQMREEYAKLLVFSGAYQEALVWIEKELKQRPSIEMLMLYAQAACGLALHEQAVSVLEQALSTALPDIERARLFFKLGEIFTDMGEASQAVAYFREFCRLPYRPHNKERQRQYERRFVESKTLHDIEQLEYLLEVAELSQDKQIQAQNLLGQYQSFKQDFDARPAMEQLEPEFQKRWSSLDLRHFYIPQWKPPSGPLLNPDLPFDDLQQRYFEGEEILVFDQFLRPEVLAWLREYCLQSTFWNDYWRSPGYIGVYDKDGFYCELLFQLAQEMRERFPRILGPHALNKVWAYKYNNHVQSGVHPHVDPAAVNINFWLTPDSANLEPEHGGLIVFPCKLPLLTSDLEIDTFNNSRDYIIALMKQNPKMAIQVPYRQNRALFFNSAYFHKSDDLNFAPGYTQRRLNFAYIFGKHERKSLQKGNLNELASLFDVYKTTLLRQG